MEISVKFLAVLSIFLLVGCEDPKMYSQKSDLDFGPKSSSNGGRVSSRKDTITFEEISNKVIKPHCIKCHKGYKSYKVVKKNLGDIIDSIESGWMPKNAPALENDLRNLMIDWQAQGALEAKPDLPSDTPVELPTEGPTEKPTDEPILELNPISFKEIQERVLTPHCTRCHRHSDYNDYETVKINLVDIIDSVESGWMPRRAAPLTDDLKTLLSDWQAQGAKE